MARDSFEKRAAVVICRKNTRTAVKYRYPPMVAANPQVLPPCRSSRGRRADEWRAGPIQSRIPGSGPPSPAPVAQLDRASVYETEGHRFESCRARSPKAVDSAQRCEVLRRRRDLPDSVETAVPVLKPNRTIAQTSPRASSDTRSSRLDRLGALPYSQSRRFESGPRYVLRDHRPTLSRQRVFGYESFGDGPPVRDREGFSGGGTGVSRNAVGAQVRIPPMYLEEARRSNIARTT